MTAADRTEAVAQSLANQRLARTQIDVAEELRPRDEAEAYALQAKVNRRLSASRLGQPIGHKIGCTTPVMQAYLGIPNPCAGEIFANSAVANGGSVSRSDFLKLGVECEIVVRLARDVLPAEAPFTRGSVGDLVGSLHAGIELVDDRYADYRALGALTLIADNFFNAGCVLGEPLHDWRGRSLTALAGRMLVNGEEAGRGQGGMILGHPFEALAWLANSRAARGLGLAKHDIVFLGSIVQTRWVAPGDAIRIEVEALGAVELEVSP